MTTTGEIGRKSRLGVRYAKSLVRLTREANLEDDSRGLFRVRRSGGGNLRTRPYVEQPRNGQGDESRARKRDYRGKRGEKRRQGKYRRALGKQRRVGRLANGRPFSPHSCLEKLLRVNAEKLLCLTNHRPFQFNRERHLRQREAMRRDATRLANPFSLFPFPLHMQTRLFRVYYIPPGGSITSISRAFRRVYPNSSRAYQFGIECISFRSRTTLTQSIMYENKVARLNQDERRLRYHQASNKLYADDVEPRGPFIQNGLSEASLPR